MYLEANRLFEPFFESVYGTEDMARIAVLSEATVSAEPEEPANRNLEAMGDDFSAAFADDETDYENFDQTRHAGTTGMRDHPGEEWDEVDDISDASFPASDPPSFNPGTA